MLEVFKDFFFLLGFCMQGSDPYLGWKSDGRRASEMVVPTREKVGQLLGKDF